MIYDDIKNIGIYKGMHDRLDKALDFLKDLDVEKLTPGKFELDGSDLFYMVQDYETIPEENGKYESHNNYMDIQLLVSGSEIIRCTPYVNPEVTVEYSREKDIEFYKLDKGYDFNLIPGRFVILMPKELHAPKIMESSIQNVRKVVIKILK